jgi:hypothetical protein
VTLKYAPYSWVTIENSSELIELSSRSNVQFRFPPPAETCEFRRAESILKVVFCHSFLVTELLLKFTVCTEPIRYAPYWTTIENKFRAVEAFDIIKSAAGKFRKSKEHQIVNIKHDIESL